MDQPLTPALVAGGEPVPGPELLEEKRCRRRAKNKAKKEDLKRVREEEIRRTLYEPKTRQGVRLVGAGEAATLRGLRGPQASGTTVPIAPLALEDFPDLGRPGRQHRRREEPTVAIDLTASAGAEPGRQGKPPVAIDLTACMGVEGRQGKHRRARPITIDLMSAVKRPPEPPAPAPKRKSPSRPLGGNQLDSSNPERRKGKTRENPRPQKPSHLKAVILADRKARQAGVEAPLQPLSTTHSLPLQELTNRDEVEPRVEDVASVEQPLLEEGGIVDSGENIEGLVSETGALGLDRTPSIHIVGTGDQTGALKLEQPPSDHTMGIGGQTEAVMLDQPPSMHTVGTRDQAGALKLERPPSDHTMGTGGQTGTVGVVRPRSIHSRKFRDYCEHVQSPELDAAVTALITDIVRFQDRLYFSDPVKAHAKRRFVLGFRETGKYLGLRKLKLLVIAPDLETARSEGGIEDTVARLKDEARLQDVPCVFSLGRATLRRLTNKSCAVKGISCIGVLSYEGSQDNFHAIRELLPGLAERYRNLVAPPPPPLPVPPLPLAPAPTPTPVSDSDVNQQVVAAFLGKLAKELE